MSKPKVTVGDKELTTHDRIVKEKIENTFSDLGIDTYVVSFKSLDQEDDFCMWSKKMTNYNIMDMRDALTRVLGMAKDIFAKKYGN